MQRGMGPRTANEANPLKRRQRELLYPFTTGVTGCCTWAWIEARMTPPGDRSGASAARTFLVTVHGIGPYDASHGAAARLFSQLDPGLAARLTPVDFDWFAMVEAGN